MSEQAVGSSAQWTVEAGDGLERRLKVQVPAARLSSAIDAKLAQLTKTVRVDGFRKGKVPTRVVRQMYGDSVRNEALGEAIEESFREAIRHEELAPAGGPEIVEQSWQPDADLSYTAVFEVYPSIELGDLSGLEVERPVASVTDDDVERMIEQLRAQRKEWQPRTEGAGEGDRVVIDFKGLLVDTDEPEAFPRNEGEGLAVELGKGEVIAEIEQALFERAAGESLSVDMQFPESAAEGQIAGRPARFEVTVRSVERAVLPPVDGEFAQAFGIEDGDVDAFRASVRANMGRELDAAIRQQLREQVLDALGERFPIPVPTPLVEQEVERVKERLNARHPNFAEMLEQRGEGERLRASAERTTRVGLLIGELVRDQGLEVDPETIEAALDEATAEYEQPDVVKQIYRQNQELMSSIESRALERKVVEFLLARAYVKERPMSFWELTGQAK